jgi:hypothetical protein
MSCGLNVFAMEADELYLTDEHQATNICLTVVREIDEAAQLLYRTGRIGGNTQLRYSR